MNRTLRLAVLWVLASSSGCAGGGLPPDVPARRPSDGLLGDPALQSVVELQVARDAPGLVAQLGSDRAAVRARAAFALASVQDTMAVPSLVVALGDADAGVRRDAAFALGQARHPGAAGPLADAFASASEPEAQVRDRILEALGKVPTMEAVASLLALQVASGEEARRTLAVARLGAVGNMATAESQDFLLVRLDDPDPSVRAAAAYYFGRLAAAGPWAQQAPRVRQALDAYRLDAPEAMYLVQALGKLADAQDGARLRRWLSDAEDWRIRSNAAAALGALPPDPDNRQALLDGLDDASVHVSVQAAQGVARGSLLPSELPGLKAWVEAHPRRRPAISPLLSVLARADERDFVFRWIDALEGDDVIGWTVGLQALGSMPGREAMERLVEASGLGDPRVAGPAVSALATRWESDRQVPGNAPRYFAAFSAALSASTRAAARAAGALADSAFIPLGSVGVLAEAFRARGSPEDARVRVAILEALGALGLPEALPVVREALEDTVPAVRAAAASALVPLGGEAPPAETAEDEAAPPTGERSSPALDWTYLAGLGVAPRWVLETDHGTVVVQLDTEEAPLTTQTLARLTEEGRYDGVIFHRVVPNFVAQGGDVGSGDGSGGPGFSITSEFTQVPYLRGGAGMASAGKDTEGSQFFFTHSMQPHLDGSYTTFGWVVSGMDVVDRLDVGDRIVRATVERGG